MRLDYPFCNGKTETRASGLTPASLVNTVEPVKNLWPILRGNSGAIILDLHCHLAAACLNLNPNRSADRRIFHGVVENIHECLPEKQPISPNRCGLVAGELLVYEYFRYSSQAQVLGDPTE